MKGWTVFWINAREVNTEAHSSHSYLLMRVHVRQAQGRSVDGGGQGGAHSAEFETGGAHVIGVTESAALYGNLARWSSNGDSQLGKSGLRVRAWNSYYLYNFMSTIHAYCTQYTI